MKKKLSVMIILALSLTMLPVQDMDAAAKKPSVTKSMVLKVGKSKTIKVKGSYIKSKKYKTSNKKIATVSKKGKVTAKKQGTVKLQLQLSTRKKRIRKNTRRRNTPVKLKWRSKKRYQNRRIHRQ